MKRADRQNNGRQGGHFWQVGCQNKPSTDLSLFPTLNR
jgi:hypothetical protein